MVTALVQAHGHCADEGLHTGRALIVGGPEAAADLLSSNTVTSKMKYFFKFGVGSEFGTGGTGVGTGVALGVGCKFGTWAGLAVVTGVEASVWQISFDRSCAVPFGCGLK